MRRALDGVGKRVREGNGVWRCHRSGAWWVGSFLAGDGLGYGAGRDHVQQVLPLPVGQAGAFLPAHVGRVQVGNVHT